MLLPPARIAELLSRITTTMLRLSLSLADGRTPEEGAPWRTAVIAITGERPLAVALSSDALGCNTIGAAMFLCAADDVDDSMAEDALAELANVTAGEIKRALALDQTICLPRIVRGTGPITPDHESWEQVLLTTGDLDLVFSISTNRSIVEENMK